MNSLQKKSRELSIIKRIKLSLVILLVFILSSIPSFAQLTGIKNIPGDYATVAAAAADLNVQGVGAGGVTFSVAGGHTETAPSGGIVITASGTALNQIIFEYNGSGGNPIITAFSPQPFGAINDGVIKLIGADYVTIDGIQLIENASNNAIPISKATPATNTMTEWGVALLYATPTNGAQNNTIKNCNISLSGLYSNTFAIYSNTRHNATSPTVIAEATSANGANSFNKIYSNTIYNINYGIIFIGCGTNISAIGNGNDIGGNSTSTGNNLLFFGYSSTIYPSAWVSLPASYYGILINQQTNENVSYNQVNSSGLSVPFDLMGIWKCFTVSPPTSGSFISNINFNSVSVKNNSTAATVGNVWGILSQGLTTSLPGVSININNNLVSGCNRGGNVSTTNYFSGISTFDRPGVYNINGNTISNNIFSGTAATTGSLYGISNNGAVATLNMNNNIISGFTNNTNTLYSGGFFGIANFGMVTSTININNNEVGTSSQNAISYSLAANSSIVVGILNNAGAAGCALSISDNSIRGLALVTSSTARAIENSSAFIGGTININNNNIGSLSRNFVTFSNATSSVVSGIRNLGGSVSSALSISGNDFQGFVHTTAGSSSHTYVSNTFATNSQNLSSNTFTNLNVNTSGSVIFIANAVLLPSTGVMNINGNSIVTGFNKSVAGGTVTFYSSNASSVNGAVCNITNNILNNVTLTGSTGFTGISNTDGASAVSGPMKTITGNQISVSGSPTGTIIPYSINFSGANSVVSSNEFSNSTLGVTSCTGFLLGSSNQATLNFSSNTINNITNAGTSLTGISSATPSILIENNSISELVNSNSTGTMFGMSITGGTSINISKNKLCGFSTSGTQIYGISTTGGSGFSISNNRIGDLHATASTNLNAVLGINANAAGTYNISYNTVYLNTTSSSLTTYGNSCMYFTSAPTSMTLRNNIFVNLSTPAQNGLNNSANGVVSCIRRLSGTNGIVPANYSLISNNNSVWCNPSAGSNNHLTYVEGTTTITNPHNTLSSFKSFLVDREQLSVEENPVFLSSSCSSTDFLKVDPSIPTQIESTGTVISGITTDFEGDIRNGSSPDMGADEFMGIAADLTPPAIVYTPLSYTCIPGNRTLTASITDATGVPVIGSGLPVLYWSINNSVGPFTAATGTHTGGSNYNFVFGGGSILGDQVYYYIVAQDNAVVSNIVANPSTGAAGYASNPPSVATPPASPNSYIVSSSLGGTYSVGSGGDFPTLTSAANAYNNSCISGAVIFELTDSDYLAATETFPITFNANPFASATNTLTIRPAAGNASSITAGTLSGEAVIKLNGADYITIDGVNAGGASLLIENTSVAANTAVIWLASLSANDGASNTTIKNCNIKGGSNTTISTTGIFLGSQVILYVAGGQDHDNVTIENNTISKAYYGISASAAVANVYNNLVIRGNSIGSNTVSDYITYRGVFISSADGALISENTIFNIISANLNIRALEFGLNVTNSTISKNVIRNIDNTSLSFSAGKGITLSSNLSANVTISNNMISGLKGHGSGTATNNSWGIMILGGTDYNIYHNSINISDNRTATSSLDVHGGIYIASGSTGLNVKNNLISVTGNAGNVGGGMYGIYSLATSPFTFSNNNNFHINGVQHHTGFISGVNQTTLLNWQSATSQDANSVTIAPIFAAPTDLHLIPASNLLLNDLGTFVASVADDIDGDVRDLSTPDIGADEFNLNLCVTAIGGTASGSTSFCNSGTPVISASGYSSGIGSTYQWYTSSNSGDYPNLGSSVVGQTNPSSLTTGSVSSTTYYWLRVTCATNTSTNNSSMVTIAINSSSSSVAGPVSKCANDPAVTLNENGGTGNSWLWNTGATTQSISVNPTSNTVYTVTVTSPGSCVSTANYTMVVHPNPTGLTANATASSICTGGIFDLTSNASLPPVNIMTQNFESAIAPWTSVNNTTGGSNPSATAWSLRPHGFVSSNSAPVTYNSPGGSQFILADSDIGGTGTLQNTILTSPVFSTVNYTSATLSFRHYYRYLAAETFIEVSTNGTTWTNLKTYTANQGTATSFVLENINLDAYVGYSNVSIRFRYTGGWAWYWAIDDIAITGAPASYSYSWMSSPTSFSSNDQNPTGISPVVSTSYTVTVTGIAGCTSTGSTGIINVNDYPVADAPSNVTACDSYTLPALTVGNYFTGSGGTGTALSAGNLISSTQLIYVYAETGTTPNCTDENNFTVTISTTPVADAPANVTACDSYTLPALAVGNYFTGTGGTGTALFAGNNISSTQLIYVYAETGTTPNCTDENNFTVTINTTPGADAPSNVTACDSYTLPALTVGNYFTGSGGTGTALSAGNLISSTQLIYVYAETGTTPNCTDENNFTVTINTSPDADAPSNVTACDSYTLPALTVGNYFTSTGGTGSALSAGNSITSTQLIYVYAETGTTPNCTDENNFTVTINSSPVADAPSNVTACDSYTLPALTVGNYFTGTGGTGTALSAGNVISSTQLIYVYAETGTTPNCTDENNFTVTINSSPVADAPANVIACDSYTLPALTVGNYFTGSGGTGTALSAGNLISSTQLIYVYAETGTTPNCTDENNFTVTINSSSVADAPANVIACDSYTLPALTVGNYFTGTGGTGTALSAGNIISSTQLIYVYAETGTTPNCTDENNFTVTINSSPVAAAPANVTACDSYTLPALTVGNYFTGTGGTGTALSAGNVISSTQLIYVYAETGTTPNCTDENSFTVTIDPSPTTAAAGPDQGVLVNSATLAGNAPSVGTGLWSVIAGSGTFVDATDAGTVVNGLSAGLNTFRWTTSNGVCTDSFDDVNITFSNCVNPTANISGEAEICAGGSTNITLTLSGVAPFTYAINGGTPVVTSNTTEILSVNPTSTTVYTITSFSDALCSGIISGSSTVTITNSPPASSCTITTLPVDACVGNTVVASTNVVSGATSYTWSAPAGTLINGLPSPQIVASNSVNITLGTLPTNSSSWLICAFASNACGNTNTNCKYIRGSLSMPSAIVGSTVACPNTGPSNYTTNAVSGASSYLWTITGDASVSGTGTTGAVIFGPTFTTGSLCVRALLPCGFQGAQRCLTIANGTPLLGAMTGTFTVCPGTNGVAYNVPPSAGATTYNWTLPSGASVATGAGTNSITVNFGPSYTNGNVCVTAQSICGITSLPRCKTVASNKPGTPGNFTTGATTGVCGQTITYNVNTVAGATGYTWTTPAGASLASANGTNTIDIAFAPGYTTGNVCVTADNSCGSGTPRCVIVKGNPSNPGVVAGLNSVCANDAGIVYSIAPIFGSTGYIWFVPSGATIISGQGTTAIIVDWGSNGGVIGVTASGTCGNSGTRTLNVAMTCKVTASDLPGTSIIAYPNPASSILNIELKSEKSGTYAVQLLDLSGRVIYSSVINTIEGINSNTLDVSELAKGVYMLKIEDENLFGKKLKIVVE